MHSMLNLTFVVLITIDFGKAKVHLKITLACLLCQFCMLLDNHFTIINFLYIKFVTIDIENVMLLRF